MPLPMLPGTESPPSAYLFDLDGVLTPTAEVHRAAWRRLFESALPVLDPEAPPYVEDDYFRFIDGRPRYAGVAALLASRGIAIPEGSPSDAPGTATICALGNAKDAAFRAALAEEGTAPYPGSVRFLDALARAGGVAEAVVTSSANAGLVLDAAGLADRFPVVVDGLLARREGLAGKPAPDTYLRAAELVGVAPAAAAIVEDAVSGVAAGRAGGFGLVVGVDRGAGAAELRAAGAHLVVADLADFLETGS